MRPLIAMLLTAAVFGAEWPKTLVVGADPVLIAGQGRFSWLWYDVYDVCLHLPAGATDPLADAARRISFRYLRPFTAAELGKATTKTLRERAPSPAPPELETGLAAINALWPSVVKGDELILTYAPGTGVTVSFNGKDQGTVPGAVFAKTLFSIWIGPKPIDDDLRKMLTGR